MDKQYKSLIKNTGILTISSFSSKILVFLLVPLYTSILTTEEYGFFDITQTTIQLAFPLLTADIISAIMRFCMDCKNDTASVISIGLRTWLISTLVFSGAVLLNIPFEIVTELRGFEILLVLMYGFYSLHQLFIQTAKGTDQVKILAISGVIGTICVVLFNILFLVVLNKGLKGFYLANILGDAAPAIYMIVSLNIRKYVVFKRDRILIKRMLKYSIPLVVNTIGWWVNNNIDKYIITWLCDLSTNGLLSVAYKIPNILTVVGGIFLQAWQISAVKEYETDESEKFYNTIYKYYNLGLLLTTTVLIFLIKPISHLLFQKEFSEAWVFVPFLLISCFFTQIASFYGPILSALMDSKAMAISSLIGIITNVSLNIGLTLLIGPVGIAVATAISSFVIYVIRRWYVNKRVRIEEKKQIYAGWVLLCVLSAVVTMNVSPFVSLSLTILIVAININDVYLLLEHMKKWLHERRKSK